MQINPSTQLRFLSALQLQASGPAAESKSAETLVEAAIAHAVPGSNDATNAEVAALRKSAAAYLGLGGDLGKLSAKLAIDLAAAALAMTTQDVGNRLSTAGDAAVDKATVAESFDAMLNQVFAPRDDEPTSAWQSAIEQGTADRKRAAREAAEEFSDLAFSSTQRGEAFDTLAQDADGCRDLYSFRRSVTRYARRAAAAGNPPDTAQLDDLMRTARRSYFGHVVALDLPHIDTVESALQMAKTELAENDPLLGALQQQLAKAELVNALQRNPLEAAGQIGEHIDRWGLDQAEANNIVKAVFESWQETNLFISQPEDLTAKTEELKGIADAWGAAAGMSTSAIGVLVADSVEKLRQKALRRVAEANFEGSGQLLLALRAQRPLNAAEKATLNLRYARQENREATASWRNESSSSYLPSVVEAADRLLESEEQLRALDPKFKTDSTSRVEETLRGHADLDKWQAGFDGALSYPSHYKRGDAALSSRGTSRGNLTQDYHGEFRDLGLLEERGIVDAGAAEQARQKALSTIVDQVIFAELTTEVPHKFAISKDPYSLAPDTIRARLQKILGDAHTLDDVIDVDKAVLDAMAAKLGEDSPSRGNLVKWSSRLYAYARLAGQGPQAKTRIRDAVAKHYEFGPAADALADAVCRPTNPVESYDFNHELTTRILKPSINR